MSDDARDGDRRFELLNALNLVTLYFANPRTAEVRAEWERVTGFSAMTSEILRRHVEGALTSYVRLNTTPSARASARAILWPLASILTRTHYGQIEDRATVTIAEAFDSGFKCAGGTLVPLPGGFVEFAFDAAMIGALGDILDFHADDESVFVDGHSPYDLGALDRIRAVVEPHRAPGTSIKDQAIAGQRFKAEDVVTLARLPTEAHAMLAERAKPFIGSPVKVVRVDPGGTLVVSVSSVGPSLLVSDDMLDPIKNVSR
jgi:hypothetical protein